MDFTFYCSSESYKLVERYYDPLELLSISDCVFRHLESINKLGFVPERVLDNIFMSHFGDHLESMGFESKLLGNAELPYTLWFNFIFINVYYLIIKFLQTFNDKGFVKCNMLN